MIDESGGGLVGDAREQARRHLVAALALLLNAGGPVTALDHILDAMRELEALDLARREIDEAD